MKAGIKGAGGRLWVVASLIVVLAIAGLTRANDSPAPALPPGLEVPGYAPGRIPFRPGQQLFYSVFWEGLPVAFARISLRCDPASDQNWLGEAAVSTNKLVDVFYRMRANLVDEFAPQSLALDKVMIRQREKAKLTEYSIDFDRADGLVRTTRSTHEHSESRQFSARHPVGPISGTLLALSQPLRVGDAITLDVFAGSNRFVVQFRVVRRERLHIGPDDVDALRVVPTLLYLSNAKDQYKVRQVTVWVSADQRHLPLRIVADAFVGRLVVSLDGSKGVPNTRTTSALISDAEKQDEL